MFVYVELIYTMMRLPPDAFNKKTKHILYLLYHPTLCSTSKSRLNFFISLNFNYLFILVHELHHGIFTL